MGRRTIDFLGRILPTYRVASPTRPARAYSAPGFPLPQHGVVNPKPPSTHRTAKVSSRRPVAVSAPFSLAVSFCAAFASKYDPYTQLWLYVAMVDNSHDTVPALVFYDHILTLPKVLRLVAKKRKSGVSVFLLVNRALLLVYGIALTVQLFRWTTPRVCCFLASFHHMSMLTHGCQRVANLCSCYYTWLIMCPLLLWQVSSRTRPPLVNALIGKCSVLFPTSLRHQSFQFSSRASRLITGTDTGGDQCSK